MITSKLTPTKRIVDRGLTSRDKRWIKGHFVKGPIPLTWISKAAHLPGKSMNAAVACWYLKGLKKSHTFKLSNIVASRFGLNKDSKARALKHLEQASLIRCTYAKGRSVVVEMLNTGG